MNDMIKSPSALRAFLKSEAIGGIFLISIAAFALILANSPLASVYFDMVYAQIGPVLTPKLGPMTVHLWINDGAMAIFFLLVGLEIKREFADGELANWSDRRLPMIAAAAGMAVPAFIYLTVSAGHPELARGWAIPAATDIAFAMGVLALLGNRVPASLKLLLTTIAIVDDLGAVVIIAFFYTSTLNLYALAAAAAIWAAMLVLCRRKVMTAWPYIGLGVMLWYAVLMSGVHATIAGVLMAFAIPFERTLAMPDAQASLLHRMEHVLSVPTAYIIVPLFGFANAGVSFAGGDISPFAVLPLAVSLGLFLGKQIGIFGSIWCAVKLGFAAKPKDAGWTQIYGLALLCGIGFTMSLFIGGLAFTDTTQVGAMKIGVLTGSVLSAFAGAAVLRYAALRKNSPCQK